MSCGELPSLCGIQMSLHAEFRGAQYERVGQISAFRREIDGNCVLLGYYAVRLFEFFATASQWARASSFTRFLYHTQRRAILGRTPLEERSARRRDFYLIKHTKLTTDKRPCPRWDSNTQYQQARGRRPTP